MRKSLLLAILAVLFLVSSQVQAQVPGPGSGRTIYVRSGWGQTFVPTWARSTRSDLYCRFVWDYRVSRWTLQSGYSLQFGYIRGWGYRRPAYLRMVCRQSRWGLYSIGYVRAW